MGERKGMGVEQVSKRKREGDREKAMERKREGDSERGSERNVARERERHLHPDQYDLAYSV